MKPIPEYDQLTDNLFVWHGYNPECKTDCASTAVRTPEGFVLIDPIRLEEQALERMIGDDRIAAILLTNGNHLRGSLYEKERLDIPLLAPEGAHGEVEAGQWIKDGEVLFQTLLAVELPGGGPGETAFLASDALILGDALINLDGPAILPDKYCEDPKLLRASLQKLLALNFRTACFAHGLPIVSQAKESIAAVVS